MDGRVIMAAAWAASLLSCGVGFAVQRHRSRTKALPPLRWPTRIMTALVTLTYLTAVGYIVLCIDSLICFAYFGRSSALLVLAFVTFAIGWGPSAVTAGLLLRRPPLLCCWSAFGLAAGLAGYWLTPVAIRPEGVSEEPHFQYGACLTLLCFSGLLFGALIGLVVGWLWQRRAARPEGAGPAAAAG